MTLNVLLGPAEFPFINDSYARTYNYLRCLPDDVAIDAIVGNPKGDFTFENARLFAIKAESKLRYRLRAYRRIGRSVEEYDIYHYPNMNFPDWNPILLSDYTDDVPVVIGPCEAGHVVPPESFHNHINGLFGSDIPERLAYVAHDVFQVAKKAIQPTRELLFSRTLASADRIVTVNEATKAVYEEYVDTDIEVIPYGVNLNRFEYTERVDSKEILTVSTLISRKGQEYLLRALPDILSEVPDASLHIVGTGPRENELRELANDLGIDKSVTFYGHLSSAAFQERFRRAQVFVHPSVSEGYSHIRLEAMANGCPVVGTNVRGATEMIREGIDGFIVEREEPDALAERTSVLLGDIDLARQMGENARTRIEERHDWAEISGQYLKIYQQLIK